MPTKIDGNNGVLQSYDYQVLTTGFSYTFASGTTTLIAQPAGTLATGTITMPGSPADGMVITFMTTQEITALTIAGGAGQSIGGTQVSSMAANSSMSFVYRLSNLTWYRTSAPALGNVGTAPVYAARAWVNFNGTGTVAIRASGNVSSITDNGTGDYTVNFTTAMPDANYSAVFGSAISWNQTNGDQGWANLRSNNGGTNPQQTSSVRVWTSSKNSGLGSAVDIEQVNVTIHR
jgi:hypothetical protein